MIIGNVIIRCKRVTSTNDLARAAGDAGHPEGLVITAEEQLAGRGRMGRRWFAPPGTSIQLSVLLRPPLPPQAANRLSRMAGLALSRTLQLETSLAPTLKWPNDVLLRGRKCAGILVETSVQGQDLFYAVLGIGLNVNFSMSELPDLAPFATTLADELGHSLDRAAIEHSLLENLDAYYARLLSGETFLDEYRAALVMLGHPVNVSTADGILRGTALDVDDEGALVLQQPEGFIRVFAGDVSLLRESWSP